MANETNTPTPQPLVQRRDARLALEVELAVQKIAESDQRLSPELERVYERLKADPVDLGRRFSMTLRDLSVNGAFIEGDALPLRSRLAMAFDLPDYRRVEAIGWVMWRRTGPCTVQGQNGKQYTLKPGVGVLFEFVPLDVRIEINRRVRIG